MKRALSGLAALIVAVDIGEAFASDDEIDDIVVTASRLERSVDLLGMSVTVIDRATIDARQPASVSELLRHVPGVNVVQQGSRGGITNVLIRGGEPNFTVVLIDGVKVNDSTNTRGGSFDFSTLDVSNVARVEIVRGPMSAIHGSDALAGVINIVTRQSDGLQFRAELGNHGLHSGRFAIGKQSDTAETSLAIHALNDDGDIQGSQYDHWGLNGSLTVNVDETSEAGVTFRYTDAGATSFPEDSGGPEFAAIRDVDSRDGTESHVRLHFQSGAGKEWTTRIFGGRYEREEYAISPGIAPGVLDGVPPNRADTRMTRDFVSFSFSRQIGQHGSFVGGAEWQREDGRSDGELDVGFPLPTRFRLRRDTLSAFAEVEYDYQPLSVAASLRRDDPDNIGAETSARVAATWSLPGGGSAVRLSWGEAFKAPSFFALSHPIVGNPALLSETATSTELGYRFQTGTSSQFEVSAYRNEFKNLVDFDPVLFRNVNRSNVVIQGADISGKWSPIDAVTLTAHLGYLDTDIRNSDATLRSRPDWRGGASVEWQMNDRWRMSASFLALDDFLESSIPTGATYLAGYSRIDLAVTFKASDTLRFGLAIDNVLGEDYFEAVGFPAAGTRIRLNVTAGR